jgi:hypothetical protein
MQTDYWKSTEAQSTFEKWHSFLEGCLHCACDHGCNQWVKEQGRRSALLFRILAKKDSTTSLDRVTQMPLEKVNAIWFRITSWESDKWNRENRKQEAADALTTATILGIGNIKKALEDANGDRRKAEEVLGLPKYGLSAIMAYVINKDTDENT